MLALLLRSDAHAVVPRLPSPSTHTHASASMPGGRLRFEVGPTAGIQLSASRGAATHAGSLCLMIITEQRPSLIESLWCLCTGDAAAGASGTDQDVNDADDDDDESAVACARGCSRLLKHASLRNTELPGNIIVSLLEQYVTRASQARGDSSYVRIMRVVVELCEDVGPSALRNTTHAIKCIHSILNTYNPDEAGNGDVDHGEDNAESSTDVRCPLRSMPGMLSDYAARICCAARGGASYLSCAAQHAVARRCAVEVGYAGWFVVTASPLEH